MRVAFVCLRTSHLSDSPLAIRIRRVAERLANRGHEVTVCCTQWWDGDHAAFDQNGVTYVAVTRNPSPDQFAAKLPFVLARLDPDVIHAAGTPSAVAIGAAGARLTARAPVLVEHDGGDGTAPTWTDRLAVRFPNGLLVPSRHVMTEVRSLGADESSVHVVPESIDVGLVRDREPAGRADVVYSGPLDADANVETLLLALAELRGWEWRASVVGDGPERDRYERHARDLRIDDRVSFPGTLPTPDRVSLFKRAHVFVQTAERCSFATELLWALACGCVGVVEYQAHSSAHELVEGFDRGFLATGDESITDAIVAAVDLPRRRFDERFAEFDHDAILDRYLDRYREAQGIERVARRRVDG